MQAMDTTEKESRALNKNPNRALVNILGDRYLIRGEATPGYIAEIAEMVDTRMRELKAASKTPINKTQLAVLAAVNLADELKQMQTGSSLEADEIARRTNQLITLLDEGLTGDRLPDRT